MPEMEPPGSPWEMLFGGGQEAAGAYEDGGLLLREAAVTTGDSDACGLSWRATKYRCLDSTHATPCSRCAGSAGGAVFPRPSLEPPPHSPTLRAFAAHLTPAALAAAPLRRRTTWPPHTRWWATRL